MARCKHMQKWKLFRLRSIHGNKSTTCRWNIFHTCLFSVLLNELHVHQPHTKAYMIIITSQSNSMGPVCVLHVVHRQFWALLAHYMFTVYSNSDTSIVIDIAIVSSKIDCPNTWNTHNSHMNMIILYFFFVWLNLSNTIHALTRMFYNHRWIWFALAFWSVRLLFRCWELFVL